MWKISLFQDEIFACNHFNQFNPNLSRGGGGGVEG